MDAKGNFLKQKNNIINGVIVIIAVIVSLNIYQGQNKTIGMLNEASSKEAKKNELLNNLSQLDKKINTYKDFLNKKDKAGFMNNVGNISKSCGVTIVSIRPMPDETYPFYIKHSVNLTVSAPKYETLGKFVNKLEVSDDVYAIDVLQIKPEFEGEEQAKVKGLLATMIVSTFLTKE